MIRWTLPDGRGLDLDATFGKHLDVLGLKGTSLDEVRAYATHLAARASALYGEGAPRRELSSCPCCDEPAAASVEALRVYGVPYHRCERCGHVFVRSQPAQDALEASFAESDELAAAYTDRAGAERRVDAIALPKLRWATDAYRRAHGRTPASIVDVGAGGGHFVAACLREGLSASGYELSSASRAFAAATFGIELRDDDFLAGGGEQFDLVTLFGLLEYTPEPRRFLRAARQRLTDAGLLVVEVPRFDCLGTSVQRTWPEIVARHLDPTSHVNCFSDTSLACALDAEGFEPVAAWYFGMDAYELLVQLALRLGEPMFATAGDALLALQPALDAACFCDDLVVAARPSA